MKANKTTILILTLLVMVTTACSSISSMEGKLVGEWQSNGPESIRLKIAKVGTDNEGFHDGYSSMQDEQTYTYYWRIKYDGGGVPFLALQGKSRLDDFARRNGNVAESLHRIIDLTSDKFVADWSNPIRTDIKEFQRVK